MIEDYTVGGISAEVRDRLDDPSYPDHRLRRFAKATNREICNAKRWRFLETSFTGTVTDEAIEAEDEEEA